MHGQQNIKFDFLLPPFYVICLLFVICVFVVYFSAVFVFGLMDVVPGQ